MADGEGRSFYVLRQLSYEVGVAAPRQGGRGRMHKNVFEQQVGSQSIAYATGFACLAATSHVLLRCTILCDEDDSALRKNKDKGASIQICDAKFVSSWNMIPRVKSLLGR